MSRYGNERKDGSICPYCARTMTLLDIKLYPTFDHIFPRSRRAKGAFGRGLFVCSQCNYDKADCTLQEYLVKLDEKNKQLQELIDLNNQRLENISFLLKIGLQE